jgi:hypothetical protein
LTVRPYFLWVVAGYCQNGVCCHTNYWKNHEKNIQSRYETGTTGVFFTPPGVWCKLPYKIKQTWLFLKVKAIYLNDHVKCQSLFHSLGILALIYTQ